MEIYHQKFGMVYQSRYISDGYTIGAMALWRLRTADKPSEVDRL